MNKKYIIIIIAITIAIITPIIYRIIKIPNNNEKENNELNTIQSYNGFKTYSLDNINITNPNANLIFLDNIDGTSQDELIVNVGYTYSFSKFGKHTIKVLELTDDYITISANGLAPTKTSGGFSLIENYDKITIKRNTGIKLNVQATDLHNNSVYLFYVNK